MINVTWVDAQQYVEWLSNMTGRPYRLLKRPNGNTRHGLAVQRPILGRRNRERERQLQGLRKHVGRRDGSKGRIVQAQRIRSLRQAGNAAEWVEDCWHDSYLGGPPNDGSEWTRDCRDGLPRVIRGGSWSTSSLRLRSAAREAGTIVILRYNSVGLRAARMLAQ